MNKKGQTAWTFIYGLILIFILGLMFVIFANVVTTQIVPLTNTMISQQSNISEYFNDTQTNELRAENDKVVAWFLAVPFVIFFAVIILIVAAAIRARSGET